MRRATVTRGAAALLALIIIGAGAGFVVWANDTNPVEEPALTALQSDSIVLVETDYWITLTPQTAAPTRGLIFYPGGRVDPRAYAAHLRPIAEAGHLVVIVPMPLNLAVLGINRAAEVIIANPQIETWAIGGHSLGAAMAAAYAYNKPEEVAGLVLWAGFPAASNDLSGYDLPVLSIYASEDGLATLADIDAARPLLPADTTYLLIEGGCHAGFGYYGPQNGDGIPTISTAEQAAIVSEATLGFLEGLEP